jgi:hypothetical protein
MKEALQVIERFPSSAAPYPWIKLEHIVKSFINNRQYNTNVASVKYHERGCCYWYDRSIWECGSGMSIAFQNVFFLEIHQSNIFFIFKKLFLTSAY